MPVFELPRDADGEVSPHDHPDLLGGNQVIRKIHDAYIVEGQEPGSRRLSSALFRFKSNGRTHLSFDSQPCIVALECDPAEYVVDPKFFGAVVIRCDHLRSVDTAAKPEDRWKLGMYPVIGNDCHAALWGKVTKGQSEQIQKLSNWLVPIPGVVKLEVEPV